MELTLGVMWFLGDGWMQGVHAGQRSWGNWAGVWWRICCRQWHPALSETGKSADSLNQPKSSITSVWSVKSFCGQMLLVCETWCHFFICQHWSQRGRRRSVVLCLECRADSVLYSRWGGWCCPTEAFPFCLSYTYCVLLCVLVTWLACMHGLLITHAAVFVLYWATHWTFWFCIMNPLRLNLLLLGFICDPN